MSEFKFQPAGFVPFRDPRIYQRVRNIKPQDVEKYLNPDFKICVVRNYQLAWMRFTDHFYGLKFFESKQLSLRSFENENTLQ